MRTGGLSPKQKAIASKAPPPDKIDSKDFAVLKAEKAKGRGMGLQDESIKPGKVIKAKDSKFIERRKKLSDMSEFQKRRLKLESKKIGGVMKANKGKMTPLKKDPTTPINPFEKRRKQLGGGRSKLPGRIGTVLGIGSMMVPAAYGVMKQYKDYKSAKNRDKAKVKKYSLGGDIFTQFKDIMTGSKDSKISKAKEGLKKQIAEGRAKMRDKAKVKKYSKGGGADTGKVGEIKSKLSVAMDRASRRSRDKDRLTTRDKEEAINIIRRRSRNEDRITNRDIESASSAIKGYKSGGKTKKLKDDYFKVLGVFPTVKKKMGGGMMQRPMGYTSGGKAKSKPASPQRKPEGIKDDTFDPIMKKPEGMKKELAIIQTEDAISRKNIGDGKKMTRRGLMKVVDAAADDRQLGRSLRKFQRDVFKTGGSVMARGCKLGRTKKTKLY
jgi:hypothetical protein